MRTRWIVAVAALVACRGGAAEQATPQSSFAALVADLSEPGGYFDTDNLISNERSYLHVLGRLERMGVRGGAYIGVGPDQNFSYIAEIAPSIAYIIDIRRDNLLQQLLFKALFTLGRNRAEYLALLLGRAPPTPLEQWDTVGIAGLVAYIGTVNRPLEGERTIRARVDSVVLSFGVPLSTSDLSTIDRFHRTFIDAGLSLKFHSTGRAPRFYYPTYRELLLEHDLDGRQASYLATEVRYRVVRALQLADRIIPVVGDLAGPHAMQAIGRHAATVGEQVRAFYTSNVEFYLFRGAQFDRYVENVAALPTDDRSVIVRSVFHGTFGTHPLAEPGYYSTQLVQTVTSLLEEVEAGGIRSYRDLVTKHALR